MRYTTITHRPKKNTEIAAGIAHRLQVHPCTEMVGTAPDLISVDHIARQADGQRPLEKVQSRVNEPCPEMHDDVVGIFENGPGPR